MAGCQYKHHADSVTMNIVTVMEFPAVCHSSPKLIKQGILGHELYRQIRYQSARQISLAIDLETLPDPANRIVPSRDRRDAIAIPIPEIHYNVDDYWNNGRDTAIADVTKIASILNAKIVASDLNKQN